MGAALEGWGMSLVIRSLIAAVMLLPATAFADSIVSVPIDGSIEIVGPYTSDQYGPVDVPVTISATYQIDGSFGTYPTNYGSYILSITVGNGVGNPYVLGTCYSPAPGPCGYYRDSPFTQFVNSQNMTLSSSVFLITFPPASITDEQIVITADLPDGFSVAGVPEVSTWAMLLIGFVGIGFAACRRGDKNCATGMGLKSRRERFMSKCTPSMERRRSIGPISTAC
jgi:hypothetical protein